MKLFFTKLFYCSCVLLMPFLLQAQTKFMASISPSQAGKDEYITLTLSVENGNNVQQISHPDFSDFNVLSGPNQSSSVVNINGTVTQTISLNYILQPKKTGQFTIKPCTALVDGKTYKSNTVQVSVSNQASNKAQQQTNNSPFAGMDIFDEPAPRKVYQDYILRDGETVQDKVSKNMQLKATADKTVCFVGEPIIATYKLYTRLQSESMLSRNPSFNGFSVIDIVQGINNQYNNTHEILNGREYNVYEIRKAQLYPLIAGDMELETATLDNKITFVKYAAAGDGTRINETVSLSSKPISIKVKPLPEAGKPENFSGSVGNFTIEASVEKNTFSTDEMGKLNIVVTGKGNMQLLTMPAINWGKGFEAFETKVTDNTDNKTIPVSGSKTFVIPFVVTDTGKNIIPPIQFSFFDPSTASYKTVSSNAISIQILKGTGKPASEIIASQKSKPTSFFNSFFKHRWMIISLVASIILLSLFFWFNKQRKKENLPIAETKEEKEIITNAKSEVDVLAFSNKNHLEKTENCLANDNCNDFYMHLNNEFKIFIATKYSMNKDEVTSKTIVVELEKSNLDNSVILDATQLMQQIELQLYTPFERSEKIKEVYTKAQTIIQQLNRSSI